MNSSNMRTFLIKIAPFILVIAIVIFGLVFSSSIVNTEINRVAALEEQVEARRLEVTKAEAIVASAKGKSVWNAAGVDSERVERDMQSSSELLSRVCNWSSWDEYETTRRDIEDAGISAADGQFLSEFMPYITKGTKGNPEYNLIDSAGLNMSLVSEHQYFCGKTDDTYSYTAFVEMRSVYESKGSSRNALFLYDTDAQGNVRNLRAYMIYG